MQRFLLLPPLAILLMAVMGGSLTAKGVKNWYPTIKKPAWTPSGKFIGSVWTLIYLLMIVAGLQYFLEVRDPQMAWLAALLFLLNAVLNVKWSWLFFVRHRLRTAFLDAFLLDASVLALMLAYWPVSRLASLLLLPYLLWVAFACYLNWRIERMNR